MLHETAMARLPDELFLSSAYFQIFGRPADPAGYLTYLRALRLGLPRERLLRILRSSDEALARRDRGAVLEPSLSVAPDLWPERFKWFGARILAPWRRTSDSKIQPDWLGGRYGSSSGDRSAASAGVATALAGIAAFTIATRSYLPFVRLLMQSLRIAHPEFHLFLVLVDDLPEPVTGDGWSTVRACDLGIDGFDDMSVRYDVVEFCTALKPFFMRWLLDHTQLSAVIYLDPDVRLFSPMRRLMQALEAGAPVVLTPHITAPLMQAGEPSEHTLLKSGVFNLGFVAVQRSDAVEVFLGWWGDHMRTDALVDFGNNLFTDQRWCDMAPALVPGLVILRDHTYNVAYWNLSQRHVMRDPAGQWLADGAPLVFFHFSGFSATAPETISKYQTRLAWGDVEPAQQLFIDYAAALIASEWQTAREGSYVYDRIDGVPLSPTLRRIYRNLYPQPSGLSRQQALGALMQASVDQPGDVPSKRPALTRTMRFVHAFRDDLGRSFDLSASRGRRSYEGWYWSTGVVEHGLVGLHRRARELGFQPER